MNITLPIALPEIVALHPTNGTPLFTSPAASVTDLSYAVTYDNVAKKATAHFKAKELRYARPLSLWSGAAYDAAGQFSDTDVDARVQALLSADPVSVLTALIQPLVRPTTP